MAASTSFFDLTDQQKVDLLEAENLKLFEALEAVLMIAELAVANPAGSQGEQVSEAIEGILALSESALDNQRC
jgi:hypothetical protein